MCKTTIQWGRPQTRIWCMRIACWIYKVRHTHTHNMPYLLLFHCNSGSKLAPENYVIRTLPFLLQDEITTLSCMKQLLLLLLGGGGTNWFKSTSANGAK